MTYQVPLLNKVSPLLSRPILVCMGSGGVGKTTVSAALAIHAAKSGLRVLALTIDPSERLAATLGIEGSPTGVEVLPNLWASRINHQSIFDDIVKRASKKYPHALKLLENRLYQQLTSHLSGSQEFTALEALYQAHLSQKYDLIILDTPPAKHALDFLMAPEKLIKILNRASVEWLSDPLSEKRGLLQKFFQKGTQHIFKILENLTGGEFLRELSDFFSHLGEWQASLQDRVVEVQKLLASSKVQFCVVSELNQMSLHGTELLVSELKKNGFQLHSLILNRAFPLWYQQNKGFSHSPDFLKCSPLYQELTKYYQARLESYEDFSKRFGHRLNSYYVPEYDGDIFDLQGLEGFAQNLEEVI